MSYGLLINPFAQIFLDGIAFGIAAGHDYFRKRVQARETFEDLFATHFVHDQVRNDQGEISSTEFRVPRVIDATLGA
jgi:hypothetical protein